MRSRLCCLIVAAIFCGSFAFPAWALDPEPGSVFIRVVDTGAGLCCVIKTDDDQYLVYDAGHWAGEGWRAWNGVTELVPDGEPIASMILSHSDSDHLGGVKRICDSYQVNEVVRSGLTRSTTSWHRANDAVNAEEQNHGCEDIELSQFEFPRGDFTFGSTTVTFLAGWHTPPVDWPLVSTGEERNAGSICIRVAFANKSVLFTGDAVGRHLNSGPDVCIATEKYLCDHNDEFPLDSDVVIAPHHGANNGSSKRFIETVDPSWVIFSAGHAHQHPTKAAAQRYIDHGVAVDHMLRTDRADDESGSFEWKQGSVDGHKDGAGDDDVDILIRPNGDLLVAYRFPDPTTPGAAEAFRTGRRPVPEFVLREEALSEDELNALDEFKAEPLLGPESLERTPACPPHPCCCCCNTRPAFRPFRLFRRICR